MFKWLHFILIFLIISDNLYSQCTEATHLEVQNPSFEGPSGANITPSPWSTCGITPDTQPGPWSISLPASDGNTYVGFVNGGASWLEGASQQLSGTLQANENYQFTVDMAVSNAAGGGINGGASGLDIYGSNTICTTTELLWSSPTVSNTSWQTYTVNFTPTQNFTHIYFRVKSSSPNMSYILLDNITPIASPANSINITSHSNGDSEGCSFLLSGNVGGVVPDSVILSGNFTGSPLKATLNNFDWSSMLNFGVSGTQSIRATAYFIDPSTNTEMCIYAEIEVGVNAPTADFTFDNVCIGEDMAFTNASAAFGTHVIIGHEWDFGDGNSSSFLNSQNLYSTPGIKEVELKIETSDGCKASIKKQVEVYPAPSVFYSAPNSCEQVKVKFKNVTSITSGSITSWDWDFDDGNTATDEQVLHTYSSPGQYTIKLVAESDNGCKDSLSKQIQIYEKPVAAFAVLDDCLNEEATFSNLSTIGSGTISSHNWDFGNATNSQDVSPSIKYLLAGDYDVSLIVVSDNGCKDTVQNTTTRFAMPIVDFSIDSVCVYNEISVVNNSTIAAPDQLIDWVWNFGDGSPLEGSSSPQHQYASAGEYTVSVIGVTNHGCVDTTSKITKIYPKPVANTLISQVCENQPPTVFTDASTITSGQVSQWIWDFGDNSQTSTDQNTSYTYPIAGNYVIKFMIASDFGCKDTIIDTARVLKKPKAGFQATILEGCTPHCVQFTDTSLSNATSIIQNQWSFGDGTAFSIDAHPPHCFENHSNTDDESFSVLLIVHNDIGCTDTVTYVDYITAFHKPKAQFTSDPIIETSMYEAEVTFTNQSIGYERSFWEFGVNNDTSNLSNSIYHYSDTGTYVVQLKVTTENNCVDSIQVPLTIKPEVSIYVPNAFTPLKPNGINDEFMFKHFGVLEEGLEFIIYDRWGTQLYYSQKFEGWDGTHKGVLLKEDVYIWYINYLDVFKEKHQVSGKVTLLR